MSDIKEVDDDESRVRPTDLGRTLGATSFAAVPKVLAPATLTQNNRPLARRALSRLADMLRYAGRLMEQERDHGRLFLLSPVVLVAGAVFWFSASVDIAPLQIAIWIFLFGVAFLVLGPARPLPRIAFGAALLFLIGMACAAWQTQRAATIVLDVPVTTTVMGRIEERESSGPGRWRYTISLKSTANPQLGRMPQRISLVARGAAEPLPIGALFQAKARLTPPAGPALPELNDFTFASYFDGIGANGFLYGAPEVLVEQQPEDRSWSDRFFQTLAKARSTIGDRIRGILPGDSGAFAASLVTDERRALSKETTDALRIAGLTHIVAISGLNMALSAGIFLLGIRHLISLSPRLVHAFAAKKAAAAMALVALVAYYLICGFGVSAERAFIMMAIMLIAVLVDRPSISLRNVAISAIIIVIMSPSEALGPSFQMSYAATLALVAAYSLWTRRPSFPQILPATRLAKPLSMLFKFIGGILFSSLIGGLSTALFAAEHFHRLTAYGLPANLLAMPIITFIVMPFGTLAMLLMPLGLDYYPWQVAGSGLDLVTAIAKMVAGWGGTMDIARFPGWFFAISVSGFLLLTLLKTRLRWCGAAITAAAFLCLVPFSTNTPFDLFIAEDGTLVGMRGQGYIATNRPTPPDFIFGQWQRALVLADHHAPQRIERPAAAVDPKERNKRLSPEEQTAIRAAMKATLAKSPEQGFLCAPKAWCGGKLDSGYSIITTDNAAYLGPACDTADIVIIAARVRVPACRSGSLLFTVESLRRTGAVELRIDNTGSPVIRTTFGSGLNRPWMRHRTYDWRTATFVAMQMPASDSDE